MDLSSPTSPGDRCAEHNLALGPTGECVLCRRRQFEPGPLPRWLSPVLLAAGLGTALLVGVALGRTRPPPPPVVEALAATAPSVEAPSEESPVAVLEAPRARELPAAPAPVPAPAPARSAPPRNYLDEAYADMLKSNLYKDAPPRAGNVSPPQPSASTQPPPRFHAGMGGYGRHGGRH